MSGTEDTNIPSPTKQAGPLGRSLVIGTQSPYLGQKSQKSIKSPVSISGGVSFRSSAGMFNLDVAQDLATMEKKKEKLQELVTVMKNKKQKILEAQQLLGTEIAKKKELENRIKMLEEQKIAQNIGDIVDPKIKQIEKRANYVKSKEAELEQSINLITMSLRSRRSDEDEEVQTLIKQTNELNNQLISSDKQLDLAKKKTTSQTPQISDTEIEEIIGLQETITRLESSVSMREKDLEVILEKRAKSTMEVEHNLNILNNQLHLASEKKEELKNKVNNLLNQKQKELNQLSTLKSEESKQYQDKLTVLKTKNQSLKSLENNGQADSILNLKQEQSTLQQDLKKISEHTSKINTEDLQTQIQQISDESKRLIEANEKLKNSEQENSLKAKQIHQYTEVVTRLNNELKQLSEETKAMAKKKEDAANFLIEQKSKLEISLKQNELHQLHNELDRLKRKLADQKNQYSKLEALNKDFVPAVMIQEYKNKNIQYQNEVKQLTVLQSTSEAMAKSVQELKEEKSTLEWADNQTALDLEANIKALKNRRGNYVADNKDLNKKLSLAQIKIKQYKEAYPTFEIKVEKKGSKKKNVDVSVIEKQVKELQSPILVSEPKEVKKAEKVQETKQVHQQVAPPKQVQKVEKIEKVVESPPIKTSTVGKSKKQKKKTTEAKQEQTLIQEIMQRQNYQQDPLLKTQSENSENKKKKAKKQKPVKTKKTSKKDESRSNIEQELEYLNQSAKEHTEKSNTKIPQLLALLIVIIGGSTYWFYS